MKFSDRIYTRYFSHQKGTCLVGVVLLGLSFTPLARVNVPYAVNQNLVFTLRYLAIVYWLLGFRANLSCLKALHKCLAVIIGIVPSAFLVCATLLTVLVGAMSGFFVHLGGGMDGEMVGSLFEGLMFWAFSASVTAGIWTLIIRKVFAQYREPYQVDPQTNLMTTSLLLMFLGCAGAHRFYLGKPVSGLLFLLTMGFLGVGVLVDGVLLIGGRFRDSDGDRV